MTNTDPSSLNVHGCHSRYGDLRTREDRPPYDWQDDARKSYRQACVIGASLRNRRRCISALKSRAALPIIEIAEKIE